MDGYNHGTMINIEENEDVKKEFNEALVKNTEPNHIEKSCNSSETNHTDYDNTDVCNTTVVQVEVDIVDGQYYETLIEIEEIGILDLQTANCDLEKIQQFTSDLCTNSLITKLKVDQHVTQSHSSAHSTTQKNIAKQVTTEHFLVNGLFNGKNTIDESCKEQAHDSQTSLKHNNDEYANQAYKCRACPMSFVHKSHLAFHERVHAWGEPLGSLAVCSQSFPARPSAVEPHNRAHAGGEKPYRWAVRFNSFSNKSKATVAKKLSSYNCAYCPMSISSRSNLVRHERLHTREKPYKCDVCWMSFSFKSSLLEHNRCSHAAAGDEKPYACDLCPKSFYSTSNLARHRRFHFREKHHKCHVCAKAYYYEYFLTEHVRLHTGEEPYTCNSCPETFSRKCALSWHKRRMHPG